MSNWYVRTAAPPTPTCASASHAMRSCVAARAFCHCVGSEAQAQGGVLFNCFPQSLSLLSRLNSSRFQYNYIAV